MKHIAVRIGLSLIVVLIAAAGMFTFPAYASAAPSASSSTHAGKHHDMSHPVYLPDLFSGAVNSPTKTKGASPYLNYWPVGNCTNNVAYPQTENGASVWQQVGSYTTAWVQYYWCPSPSNPGGYNFSYARLYVNGSGHCGSVPQGPPFAETSGSSPYDIWGASIQRGTSGQPSNGTTYYDGYGPVHWIDGVCSGQYAQDWSLPESGSYAYEAWTYGLFCPKNADGTYNHTNCGQILSAHSPYAQ